MSVKYLGTLGLIVVLSLLAITGTLVSFTGLPVHASADILYVAPGGSCGVATPCYGTVQEAVDHALPGDEIRVAEGLYPIAAGSDQVVYVGKDLTLRGGYTTGDWGTPSPETQATELTAMGQGRVVVISGTVEVTVEGLRLTFGDAEGLGGGMPGGESGGGLYVLGARVTLRHDWLLNNATPGGGAGGGLYARQSVLSVEDSIVQDNYGGSGGGLYLSGTEATVEDCRVEGNEAGGMGSKGGGIAVMEGSEATLSGNTIADNDTTFDSGSQGGGVFVESSRAILIDNTITGNYTRREAAGVGIGGGATVLLAGNDILDNDGSGKGGGLTIGWPTAATVVTLTHNTIAGNDAIEGGGVYIENTKALVRLNTIQDNVSIANGGGAYLGGGQSILFEANLVQGNRAGDTLGGGDGAGVFVATSQAILSRNVIQRNAAHRRTGRGGSGGGAFIGADADCIFDNNVVTDNTGEGFGPGIYVYGAEPALSHNTIANNSGGDGAGLSVGMGGLDDEPGNPTLRNTIIASQALGVNVRDNAPQNLAALYGVLWWANTDNYTGTVFAFHEVEGDPVFFDPAGHDYHISAGSAAIDAVVAEAGVADDLDGQTRPHYAASDLGADEWWPLVTIKSVTPDTAEPDDVVTYTLTLSNATGSDMAVSLADTLPPDVTFLGPLSYSNGSGSYAAGTITWAGTVLTGVPTILSWPVQIQADAAATITNTATVTDAYGRFETDPAVLVLPVSQWYIYLPLVLRSQP